MSNKQAPRYINATEMGDIFGISRSSIHKLSKKGLLPTPLRIGRCLRWNLEMVDKWIKEKSEE